MQVIDYFESDRQEHWLAAIGAADWGAGAFLCELLSRGTFFDAVGEGSRVLLLTEGDELISFCTYAKWDDIQPTDLTPGVTASRGCCLRRWNAWQGRRAFPKCTFPRTTRGSMKNTAARTKRRCRIWKETHRMYM